MRSAAVGLHPMLAPKEEPSRPRNHAPSVRPLNFSELGGIPVGERKPARKRNFERALRAACEAARARKARRGDPAAWDGATAAELVGLYTVFHQDIYKVSPEELEQEFLQAQAMANRCIGDLGSAQQVVQMLNWRWAKEKRKEQHTFRLGYRLMFSKTMISDYRVERGVK